MAYFKFHCSCGQCEEMVQVEGQFHRGHRPAEQAANEARAVAAQARAVERAREEAKRQQVIDNLVKGLTASNPENHVSTPTAEEVPPAPPAPKEAPLFTDNTAGVAQTAERVRAPDETAVQSRPPADGPPQYGPVDGRRWRLAEDRPSTPKNAPWIETKCGNCLATMWTRDAAAQWEKGAVCAECYYYIVSELGDYGQRQYRTQARTFHDPFRPR